MTDFHTHILPRMDDGSGSVRESLEMLRQERLQGVDAVALTPHFYPWKESPTEFLSRRDRHYQQLESRLPEGCPQLALGAEVYFFEGMHVSEDVPNLRLQGTQYLLVEMPFESWPQRMIGELFRLRDRGGIQPVLAHVDRYLRFQPRGLWRELAQQGILFQANVDSFTQWRTRGYITKMLEEGWISYLGSDCHNLESRRPNWDLLPQRVRERLAP